MAQTVKHFIYGADRVNSTVNTTPLEQQFNDFLDGHPNHKIASFSTIIGPDYKEAFVVFDIREDRNNKNNGGNK